jgi:hypothetical protein
MGAEAHGELNMPQKRVDALTIPVSLGELIDKITILNIKRSRIKDPASLRNVEHEYRLLSEFLALAGPEDEALAALRTALEAVNDKLWRIEDDIRDLDRRGDFGPDFIALARAVYQTNDRRSALKREINLLFNSDIVEEKLYAP